MRSPNYNRILVVRTDRIGDVVLSTPLIRALRKARPQAHIAVMVRPYAAPVLEGNPNIDEIIVDDPSGEHAGRTGFWKQVRTLREKKIDTALMLLPTERAAWMLFLAGIRTRIGVGHKLYEILTLMRTVSRHKYVPLRHEADYCLDLGRAIGVTAGDLTTEIFLTDAERDDGRTILLEYAGSAGLMIGMTPGSGHSSPNWTPGRYLEFARELVRRHDVRVVVSGTEAEQDLLGIFRTSGVPGIAVLPPLPLRKFIAVVSRYDYFFSASTGPMHIAAALKVPTLSLFCPLPACSPQLWGPKGNDGAVIMAPDSACNSTCGNDPHTCTMNDISADDALKEFDRLHQRITNPGVLP